MEREITSDCDPITSDVVPRSGYIVFTGVDGGDGGRTTLAMRYAHGRPNRTGAWTVNGVQQDVLTYSTGDWDIWTEGFVTVPLNSGTNNTIRIESDGTDAYVYELTVKPTETSPDQWAISATEVPTSTCEWRTAAHPAGPISFRNLWTPATGVNNGCLNNSSTN